MSHPFTRIIPPWNTQEVAALNRYQLEGLFHPFTCANNSGHALLVAHRGGWKCRDCDYVQYWAHTWMTELAR